MILMRALFGVLVGFIGLVLVIRIPWVQHQIVSKATAYASKKTGAALSIQSIHLTYFGNLELNGLYLSDAKGDTLVYASNLEVSIGLWSLIKEGTLEINSIDLSGLKTSIERSEKGVFNFDFILNRFEETAPLKNAPDDPQPKNTPLNLTLGTLHLRDLQVNYLDSLAGARVRLNLKDLVLSADSLNPSDLQFHLNTFQLAQTEVEFEQFRASLDTSTTTENPSPFFLSLRHGSLSDVHTHYRSSKDSIDLEAKINTLAFTDLHFDLLTQSIELMELVCDQSFLSVQSLAERQPEVSAQAATFGWPKWRINAQKIEVTDQKIELINSSLPHDYQQFNSDHLKLDISSLQLADLAFGDQVMGLKIKQLSLKEQSCPELKWASGDFELDHQSASLKNLRIETPQSSLKANLSVSYHSLEELMASPELSTFQLDGCIFEVHLPEMYAFAPDLASNESLQKIAKNTLHGQLTAKGNLKELALSEARLGWGNTTALQVSGILKHPTDPKNLSFDFHSVYLKTTRTALDELTHPDAFGIELPKALEIRGTAAGTLDQIKVNLNMNSSIGNAYLTGFYKNQKDLEYSLKMGFNQFNMGKLLSQPELGMLYGSTQVVGHGTDPKTLSAQVQMQIDSVQYQTNLYTQMTLEASAREGLIVLKAESKNAILDFLAIGRADLTQNKYQGELNLKLNHADLTQLAGMRQNVSTQLALNLQAQGNEKQIEWTSQLTGGTVKQGNRLFQLKDFGLNGLVSQDSTQLDLKSEVIDLNLSMNLSPLSIGEVLEHSMNTYLNPASALGKDSTKNARIQAAVTLHDSELIREVFLSDLKSLSTLTATFKLDQAQNQVFMDIKAPSLNYLDIQLDSLLLEARGSSTNFNFDLNWNGISMDPIAIQNVSFGGVLDGGVLNTHFYNYNAQDTILHLGHRVWMLGDTVLVKTDTTNLVLNQRKWTITPNNLVSFSKNHLKFEDFTLKRNAQELRVSSSIPGISNEHLGFVFNGFKLATFTSLLNPQNPVANGQMTGIVLLETTQGKPRIVSEVAVDKLEVMGVQLGLLNARLKSKSFEAFELHADLSGGLSELKLNGEFNTSTHHPMIDLNLDLKKLQLEPLNKLFGESISQASGLMKGQIKMRGNLEKPYLKGALVFDQTSFKVNGLNSTFRLPDESVLIEDQTLYLNKFRVQDEQKNEFQIDGKIQVTDYLNPQFDLSLKADGFKVLNSSRTDNDLFYGNVTIDSKLTVSGDLKLPKLRGVLSIHKGSEFVFVVPEDELALEEQQGVVVFVNKKDTLQKSNQEVDSKPETLTGYDADINLKISKESSFKVIMDEKTGDHLNVAGNGDLRVALTPLGVTTLTGRYVISEGHYEASLYNLVNRRFDLAPGGSIDWSGDPFQADLKLKAIYKTQANAAGLMSAVTSATATNLSAAYQQQLPFWVFLNIDGELLDPQLSFDLEMPKDQQDALGGQVYAQIKALNQQEEELNKQVFSLLVLNRFFPSTGDDGSGGGSSTVARDNLNKVLSGQLNAFSEKLVGNTGIDLDFGLNSTSGTANAPGGTALDINAQKQFLNDRLTVKVGRETNISSATQSNTPNNTSAIGNITIEYALTTDGRLKVKGFRKNEFDSVIDGQLIVTGASLSFGREFNELKEIFQKAVQQEVNRQDKNQNKKN